MPGTYLLPHDAPGTDFSSWAGLSLEDREIGGKQAWWIPPFHTWLTLTILESQLVHFIREAFPYPTLFLYLSLYLSFIGPNTTVISHQVVIYCLSLLLSCKLCVNRRLCISAFSTVAGIW